MKTCWGGIFSAAFRQASVRHGIRKRAESFRLRILFSLHFSKEIISSHIGGLVSLIRMDAITYVSMINFNIFLCKELKCSVRLNCFQHKEDEARNKPDVTEVCLM